MCYESDNKAKSATLITNKTHLQETAHVSFPKYFKLNKLDLLWAFDSVVMIKKIQINNIIKYNSNIVKKIKYSEKTI